MALGYLTQFPNGLNSNSQIRRSTDMAYQRGATFEVVLTGDTYIPTIELDVDLYVSDEKVGRLSVVPYSMTENNGVFTYKFNVRPYDYLSNFLKTQHHTYLWLYDWDRSNTDININNPYKNIIQWNMRYGYRYLVNGTTIKEYSVAPEHDFKHYTSIPTCALALDFNASGYTQTGYYFHLVGGSFQLDEKYIQRNFDQEVGSVISGSTFYTLDTNRRLSPMSQYLMDYPVTPQESETSRFLTDAPRIQYVQTNENHSLYFLNGLTGDRQWIEGDMIFIEFFDINNNRIDYTYNRTMFVQPTGYTPSLTITTIPVGPADIATLYETIDFTNIAYYSVQVCGGEIEPLYPVSEIFYFYIKENCKPENTRLTWLNNRGGFDYFTFTSFREDTKKIERQTYDSRYYSTNLQSPDRDVARTIKQFDANVEQEVILDTDYLTEQEGAWLEQLFYSPQVYEIKSNFISPLDQQDKVYKDLRPVQVISTEVTKVTKKHQKLNKYRITLKYASSFFVNKGF